MMRLLCCLSKNKKMKAAFRYSTLVGVFTAATTIVGGLVAGPPGLAAGGAVGGLLGAWMTSGKFKPVPEIIKELPVDEQQRLYEVTYAIVRELDWIDLAQLTSLVMKNQDVGQKLLDVLIKFLMNLLQAEIQ